MKSIHIGELIKQKFKEKTNMTISEFAKQINRTHSTVYDIFKRKSIDTDLLLKISEVLQYNFIEEVYLKRTLSECTHRYYLAVEIGDEELKNANLDEQILVLNQILKNKNLK